LSVAQFMTMALHDPADGYYSARDPFGTGGDFITSPDISQMFGELIGLWCVQAWVDQGELARPHLVELGPGRGTLIADALRAARLVPEFVERVDVTLVEASPALRAIQQQRLKVSNARIAWTGRFEPCEQPLFLIANEFFDALPVRQFVRTERGWCERMVIVDEKGALAFALSPVASAIDAEGPLGSIYEISPASEALAEEIGSAIARQGGAALIVDYGYAEPGFGETLQAVGRHTFKGLLEAPGEIDLSAHVDFARVAAAAARGGGTTFGPIGQGQFLKALGIDARAEKLASLNRAEAPKIFEAVDRLTADAQMGTLFKALAILPPTAPPPPGF